MTYIANLSTLYGHLPLDERAAAARTDGFTRVESWWDFDSAVPPRAELDAFTASIEAAEVELVALNSHGGNRARGERGLASLPDRTAEFADSITSVLDVARRLRVRKFNVAMGNRDSRFTEADQSAVALQNYLFACRAVAEVGGTILVEPLAAAANPSYPFRTGYDVVDFLEADDLVGRNIGLLFDTFHLASNGVALVPAWRDLVRHVAHVQLADAPGRGEPGSGDIDFQAFLAEVTASDYNGDISLEYLPQHS